MIKVITGLFILSILLLLIANWVWEPNTPVLATKLFNTAFIFLSVSITLGLIYLFKNSKL